MRDYYIFQNGKVSRSQNTIQITSKDNVKKSIPINDMQSIHLFGQCEINTVLISFLNKHGIPIHFYNYYGNYSGSYYPREKLLSGLVTISQAKHYLDNKKRMYLASEIVNTAVDNILANLRYYKSKQKDVLHNIQKIQSLQLKIKHCRNIDELMGIEGNCRSTYYDSFDDFIIDGFRLEKRSKMPPQNMLNALISFGNSIMYGTVLTEIYNSQLDTTISFLHEPGFRRHSLSLDLAEVFKPVIVDKTIFKILNNKYITTKDFESKLNGCYMTESGRKTFLKEYNNRLDSTIYFSSLKKNVSYRRLIRLECHKLVKHIVEDIRYIGFRQK